MTHEEIIAVIAAHRDGKKIEYRLKYADKKWIPVNKPAWNFEMCEYRIAEPRWRDATIDDLKRAPAECRVRNFSDEKWTDDALIGFSLREQSWWQTNDCLWHRQCQVLEDE